jgi:flavin reductase (DIM6/NTAB) family NADH-FMN oxidoreductase RutF
MSASFFNYRKELVMKNLDPLTLTETTIRQIRKGAFLTVKAGDKLNTMTIGWATIGYVWQRPVLMVAVRNSRHTFGLIEKAADFTVSIPLEDKWNDAVQYCGTQSGRDVDKFKECGLQITASRRVGSPVICIPGLHFECRIVLKAPMDPGLMNSDLEKLYLKKDYHTLYFGEIIDCYETD